MPEAALIPIADTWADIRHVNIDFNWFYCWRRVGVVNTVAEPTWFKRIKNNNFWGYEFFLNVEWSVLIGMCPRKWVERPGSRSHYRGFEAGLVPGGPPLSGPSSVCDKDGNQVSAAPSVSSAVGNMQILKKLQVFLWHVHVPVCKCFYLTKHV